jgi:hypothetical protein
VVFVFYEPITGNAETSNALMLKIYDSKDQVPEALADHYSRRSSDGKYEPQVEGINSIAGLLAKRDELLEKVKEIPTLKTRVSELEGLETLPSGKMAVDKKEFETLKSEHEAYTAVGKLDEIKPKVEGYDELKAKDAARTKDETFRTVAKVSGFNEDKFAALAQKATNTIEPFLRTVNENGKPVEKYFVKTTNDKGKEIETPIDDYVKESPDFKPFAADLAATHVPNGTKMIRQGTGGAATPTIETEKEAVRASGVYGL